jgi:serine/threonine-protein kinase
VADQPLLSAAERIADGESVDWLSVTSTLVDEERALADELALVQQIAEGHRQLHQLLPVAADTPAHLMPDRARWGHLDLINVLGRGSYGMVYRAWDTRLERLVALKLFHGAANPDSVMQEGRMLARVRHENVVAVYGADVIDGVAGIWMELVHGERLDRIIRNHGPMPPKEAAAIGADVARALGAVHAAGLVHCDVKAQNVVRETSGRVVLMDFGAGRLVPELRDMDQQIADVAGTPRYMAPELFVAGATATTGADIYSLGVLVYYLATGEFPVDGKTLGELKRAHDAKRVKPLLGARANIPPALNDVVMQAIERDLQLRPSSIATVQNALTAVALAADVPPRLSLAGLWRVITSLIAPAPPAPKRAEGARRKLERVSVTNDALQAAMTRHQPVRQWSDQAVAAAKLGTLIDLAFGGRSKGRAALNAYVFASNVDGLPSGVYRYDTATRELVDLQIPIDTSTIEKILSPQAGMENTAATVAMCAAFTRGSWRTPQDRDYRMALLDAGHIGQTFSVVATALGLAAFTSSVFNEKAIEEMLGLDGVSECPIYVAGVGMPDAPA